MCVPPIYLNPLHHLSNDVNPPLASPLKQPETQWIPSLCAPQSLWRPCYSCTSSPPSPTISCCTPFHVIPSPFAWRASRPLCDYHAACGTIPHAVAALYTRHVPIVRISPNGVGD